MQTVLAILEKSTDFLQKKGVEKPRLNAEHLLAKGMGCKRLDLYLRFDEVLSDEVLALLRDLVKRRGSREPLQYILGEVPFMDLKLKVKSGVLIPRPETEELLEKLEALWKEVTPKRVLDLGAGTGALALGVGQILKDVEVLGVDRNGVALELARENAQINGLEERVEFVESDWFSAVDGKFDWIVSNPPYLTEEEWASAAVEVKDYEPKDALVAENSGISDLLHILKEGKAFLKIGGGMALETGIAQHGELGEFAQQLGYSRWESLQDLSQRDRFFLAWV